MIINEQLFEISILEIDITININEKDAREKITN